MPFTDLHETASYNDSLRTHNAINSTHAIAHPTGHAIRSLRNLIGLLL